MNNRITFIHIWALVIIIGALSFLFRISKPSQTIEYPLVNPVQISADYVGEMSVYSDITLKPGVWRVLVSYDTASAEDMKSIFSVRDSLLPEYSVETMGSSPIQDWIQQSLRCIYFRKRKIWMYM